VSQRIRQVISIGAPVEKVFAYLDEPENGLALVPQLVEVKEVAPLANGGHRLRFVARGRRGQLCEWLSETVERVPNQLVAVRAETEGYTSTAVRRLEETLAGTRLSGEVEYRIDVPWPQKVLVPVMEFQARRPMRKQLRTVLELVKARIEADDGRGA
jgi:polyketide cyclase/dehydrase/lipid transport protein